MKNRSIILLSGGLDSLVALGYSKKHTDYNVELALTFDYGQKSVKEEIETSKKIALYYNVKHEVISLDWLKKITKTALVSEKKIPDAELEPQANLNTLWVPNRNGLFLNIAAAYCDSLGYNYILYGANKDEGRIFPDNTEEFRTQITKCFVTSTLVQPKVIAPLINYSKNDIVKIAVKDSMPLELVRSCYNSGECHCGRCESCRFLKRALEANDCKEYIKLLFGYDKN